MKKSKKMLAIALLVLLFIFRPQPVSAMYGVSFGSYYFYHSSSSV